MAVQKQGSTGNNFYNDKPLYSGAHFTIEVDGIGKGIKDLPTLRSVEGGGAKADVVSYQMGENGDIWRQLGKTKYDDIKLTFGLADVDGFRSWIYDFLQGTMTRKNGAILAADYKYKEQARRKFEQAMIVGLGLPKFDANDKNQANVTITLAPEKVTYEKGTGATITSQDPSEATQRRIAACNFTFSLDGFETETARTVKVEAMEIKVKTIEHHVSYSGDKVSFEPTKVPGRLEWPNLVFSVPETDAEPFRKLHNDRVTGTKKDQGQGLGASLIFFNNKKEKMGEIQFMGVHIFNVQSEKSDASSEEMKLVKIECALEQIVIKTAWVKKQK
ncbi:MAG TPA: phage tail protein [Kofleriaceae bacterium]|nr:phage tail protein [Kofleriaceae bacterium]